MAFRHLVDTECGQQNPVLKLASHLAVDKGVAEHVRHSLPRNSDELVEQYLQERSFNPQSFHMNDLIHELQDIELRNQSVPIPVPFGSARPPEDAWTEQYLEYQSCLVPHNSQQTNWTGSNLVLEEPPSFDHIWNNEAFDHQEKITTEKSVDKLYADEYTRFVKFMNENSDDQESSQPSINGMQEYLNNNEEKESITGQQDEVWGNMQEMWKKTLLEDSDNHTWLSDYQDYYDPYKSYAFADSNPMSYLDDTLERGKEFFKEGDVPSAVLCFEAAVKKHPENAEAWLLLGTTQAENEQDPNAICALKECLKIEPNNLQALMALSVSYTNESYQYQSCQALVDWLKYNEKYFDLVPADLTLSGQVTSILPPEVHKIVQNLFILAAQKHPNDVDCEVQCGLGVLFNCSSEYNKAADCFRAALSVQPNSARLWNRLGATLANGSKPEEAIDAYHMALNLEPGFIRARYNVGITCINLGSHKEAAEHFLIALNQQARGVDVTGLKGNVSQMSDTIWSTLRMSVALMNRNDLRKAIDSRDLTVLNSAFNISESTVN